MKGNVNSTPFIRNPRMNTASASDILTVPQICKQLGLKRSSIYRMLDQGLIPCRKVGPNGVRFMVRQVDLDRYLASGSPPVDSPADEADESSRCDELAVSPRATGGPSPRETS